MKLEIELDLNKIDYDSINKQILEKIEALDIKDCYAIESRIDNQINAKVEEEVYSSYNSYLGRYFKTGATDKGERLIQELMEKEIRKYVNKIMDEVFSTEYSEDEMRDAMLKMIPKVFSTVMFNRIENTLFNSAYEYEDKTRQMVEDEVTQKLSNIMRY